MDITYEAALLQVAEAYSDQVARLGGKSLARVATIVVNRGSFFERLRDGGGCSARNLERLVEWFRDAVNWPDEVVPDAAQAALRGIGRPVAEQAVSKTVVVHVSPDSVALQHSAVGKSGDVTSPASAQ